MSDDIITLFSVNIACTQGQAQVLTDRIDACMDSDDIDVWIGSYGHDWRDGELSIESNESGQPYELGDLIARWQKDTGYDKKVSFLFAGEQGALVLDCGRVDVANGVLTWNYIDLREIKIGAVAAAE